MNKPQIEMRIRKCAFEVQKLQEHPIYTDFVKIDKIIQEGQELRRMIMAKLKLQKQLIEMLKTEPEPVEEELEDEIIDDDIVPEAPIIQRRMAPDSMKRKIQANRDVSPAREKQLNEKINKKAESDLFTTDSEEFSDEETPGLPNPEDME